jgi:hypothetical protein
MDCEAETRAAEGLSEGADEWRVGAEVGVDVLDLLSLCETSELASLCKVGPMPNETPV